MKNTSGRHSLESLCALTQERQLPGVEGACWEWMRSRQSEYGQVRHEGTLWRAHRLAYKLAHGILPGFLCVCHSCDNKPCINPGHLWLGTRGDNAMDRDSKGRLPTGPAHHFYGKRLSREHRAKMRVSALNRMARP